MISTKRIISLLLTIVLAGCALSGCYFGSSSYPIEFGDTYNLIKQQRAFAKTNSELEYSDKEIGLFDNDKVSYPELKEVKIEVPCSTERRANGFTTVDVAYYIDETRLVIAKSLTYSDIFQSVVLTNTTAVMWIDSAGYIIYDFKNEKRLTEYTEENTRYSVKSVSPDVTMLAVALSSSTAEGSSLQLVDLTSASYEAQVLPMSGYEFVGFTKDSKSILAASLYTERNIIYANAIHKIGIKDGSAELVYKAPNKNEIMKYVNENYIFSTGIGVLNIIDLNTGETAQYSIGDFTEVFDVKIGDDGKYAAVIFNRMDEDGIAYILMYTLNLETGALKEQYSSLFEDETYIYNCDWLGEDLLFVNYTLDNLDQTRLARLYKITH